MLAIPEKNLLADAVVNNTVYIVSGHNGSSFSNKVFAADLNASVEGVHDLYVKTGDASTGTPTVQAEVADGSIGPSKLSSEVSNALKPVVVGQPSSVVEVSGTTAYLSVGATGGDNTYQWKKNGVILQGQPVSTLSITDLNASQHEGNYTVVVSNAFGSALPVQSPRLMSMVALPKAWSVGGSLMKQKAILHRIQVATEIEWNLTNGLLGMGKSLEVL